MSKGARNRQRAREKVAQMRAQQRRAERRRNLITLGAIVVVAGAVIGVVIAALSSGGSSSGSSSKEVIPPAVKGGAPVAQPAALVVPKTSGIRGVVAYDTTGWPSSSHNGPAARALGHTHVPGPVTYSVVPPVGGDHNATWLNCGIYDKPVPSEYAVHNLEHGAVWITYQPSLPKSEVAGLRAFVERQSSLPSGGQRSSRYLDLTPYPGLPAPVVATSWGFQLRLTSPTDPRLQAFVSKFRASKTYTPEYGGECTGGIGTPLEK
jgi:Protein of unknown function (DUF3105)